MVDGRETVRRKRTTPLGHGVHAWAFGMMTGTSMDGLDLALLRTDGETIAEFGPVWSAPAWPILARDLRAALKQVADLPTSTLRSRHDWPGWLRELEYRVTMYHGWAVEGFQLDEGFEMRGMDSVWDWIGKNQVAAIMGIHGQTVLHRPAERFTLQLFDADRFHPGWIQSEVVTNFRAADMKAGGQGAPLAPFFHFALARRAGLAGPVAFLNLGGVGNVTWVDPAAEAPEAPGALLAFDTGPANALIDDFMAARTGQGFDADGAAAARGTERRDVLDALPEFPYLSRNPPKSLDRNDFLSVLEAVSGLSAEDGAATLAAFTADCVAASLQHMPSPPTRWLVCGGGRKNLTLMKMLAERLAAPVDPVEAVGLNGDMLEAQAFAYLAVRVLRGLPTSAPSTTGCREPVCGGRISYP